LMQRRRTMIEKGERPAFPAGGRRAIPLESLHRPRRMALGEACGDERTTGTHVRVYISSTYRDLQRHRRVLDDALRKNGYDVIAMEHYVAADERPLDRCLADVRSCDLYVGVFGRRYGYVPPNETRSITELEYREAGANQIPRFCFVLSENVERASGDDDDPTQIERFKREVQSQMMTRTFDSPEDLAIEVLSALHRHRSSGPVGAIHVVRSEVEVAEWAHAAEIHFSVTNSSERTMKLAHLRLTVAERVEIDDVRLHLQGAPVEEFLLEADIREHSEVDLLRDLTVQFITPPGASEAMKLLVECADGFRYSCVLEGSYADVQNGSIHPLQPAHIAIVHPISSLHTLRARKAAK
jgi:hypothetical protein